MKQVNVNKVNKALQSKVVVLSGANIEVIRYLQSKGFLVIIRK